MAVNSLEIFHQILNLNLLLLQPFPDRILKKLKCKKMGKCREKILYILHLKTPNSKFCLLNAMRTKLSEH